MRNEYDSGGGAGEYEAPKQVSTGKGQNLRKLLDDREKANIPQEEVENYVLQEKLDRSMTRKFIDGFFFVGYLAVGIDFIFRAIGQEGMISIVWWLPQIFLIPLGLVWDPEPQFWVVGPLEIYKLHLVTLILFAIVHVSLRTLHKRIISKRLYM